MPQFGQAGGFKISIYGREENPPHFHVLKGKLAIARFKIKDFGSLDPHNIRGKKLKEIKIYWRENKVLMLAFFCTLNPKLCASQN